jgi:hypothetical protein
MRRSSTVPVPVPVPVLVLVLVLAISAGVAGADSFGGVAGNEKSYLVGRDKVCTPIAVTAVAAKGMPACRTAGTDEVAALSLKTPAPERGGEAEVRAAAKGSTLTITRKDGSVAVTWTSLDPIASVVDVWRSTYGRIVVVEYTVRRAGREVHEVVGFDLGVGGKGATTDPAPPGGKPPVTDPAPPNGNPPNGNPPNGNPPATDPAPPPADPAVTKAADKARKASGKAAIAAWTKVLALDPEHPEAHFRIAAAHAAKSPANALAALDKLAASSRPEAAEWLVEARFDRAFLKLVSDARFRTVTGLDRAPATPYERLMGLGGQWEQSLIPCDRPEITVTLRRARTFRIDLSSVCSGMRERLSWSGTWAQSGEAVELRLKKPGGGFDTAPCLMSADKDEDVLTCFLDADLRFEARPVRR